MKPIALFLLLFPMKLIAQLTGSWQGQIAGSRATLASTMIIQVSGSQVSGSLNFIQQGQTETYQIVGTAQGNSASGQLIYNGQPSMQFQVSQTSGKLVVGLTLLDQSASLSGTLTRSAGATPSTPAPGLPDDRNTTRDPAVAGRWFSREVKPGSEMIMYKLYNSDGTIDGYIEGYISVPDGSSIHNRTTIDGIEQLKQLNARWYTKNDLFCVTYSLNGKTQHYNYKYYFTGSTLWLIDLQTMAKTHQERSNR